MQWVTYYVNSSSDFLGHFSPQSVIPRKKTLESDSMTSRHATGLEENIIIFILNLVMCLIACLKRAAAIRNKSKPPGENEGTRS